MLHQNLTVHDVNKLFWAPAAKIFHVHRIHTLYCKFNMALNSHGVQHFYFTIHLVVTGIFIFNFSFVCRWCLQSEHYVEIEITSFFEFWS
jgi:hypothetical protein